MNKCKAVTAADILEMLNDPDPFGLNAPKTVTKHKPVKLALVPPYELSVIDMIEKLEAESAS